jgi:hypothetical protein
MGESTSINSIDRLSNHPHTRRIDMDRRMISVDCVGRARDEVHELQSAV